MEKKDFLPFCRYYKGEKECPFNDGRGEWWIIEYYGVNAGDKTDKDLSPTMISFIKERIWQSESGCTTTWDEALKRAKELYEKGMWNAGYITDKAADISMTH